MEKEEITEQETFCPQEEKKIAKKAKKRVAFKIHGTIYLLINLMLWVIWSFLINGNRYSEDLSIYVRDIFLFITLAWGICITAHYLIVYKWNKTLIEKEIKHLKKEKERELKRAEKLEQDK